MSCSRRQRDDFIPLKLKPNFQQAATRVFEVRRKVGVLIRFLYFSDYCSDHCPLSGVSVKLGEVYSDFFAKSERLERKNGGVLNTAVCFLTGKKNFYLVFQYPTSHLKQAVLSVFISIFVGLKCQNDPGSSPWSMQQQSHAHTFLFRLWPRRLLRQHATRNWNRR